MNDLFEIKQYSTSPALKRTFVFDGKSFPLNEIEGQVVFTMSHNGEIIVDTQPCLIDEEGNAIYYWQDGDTDIACTARGEFHIIYDDGAIEGIPSAGYIDVKITKALKRVTKQNL